MDAINKRARFVFLAAFAPLPFVFGGAATAQHAAPGTSVLRSDSVSEKVEFLQQAYAKGDFDLAMSLTESIKDTLSFERQTKQHVEAVQIEGDRFEITASLPAPWARWSAGWEFFKPLTLTESAGIERISEPIGVFVKFRDNQRTDLAREVRVARVDRPTGMLREIPSQLYDESYRDGSRTARILFLADVAANGQAEYLIFYGNPAAELPSYPTDLNVHGEGIGLDIGNRHYRARLSRQMGQLERLTYKREHGLELYAGGKGHGEPPGIDWAHDYVDSGHFQKLRMRNWAEPPNYEVVRGPLCVRVRLWGFPHSPLHPLFTPSRMHMDQTYVFYAGLPYFFKEGRFDMLKQFSVTAMRDDEWVFSGYSFSEQLWMDRDGKMHEGEIPAEQIDDLWGVGFYHAVSRDAFVALRLDHSAQGSAGIRHGGGPTLHYPGHGQLWSRYPAEETQFEPGDSIRQQNAYVVAPYLAEGGGQQLERLRRQLLHPLQVSGTSLAPVGPARAVGGLARAGELPAAVPLKTALWEALRQVQDEQLYRIDANVVDLGYVYDLHVRNGIVTVLVTMPHRGRPVYDFLVTQGGGRVDEGIYERLMRVPGVRDVVVELTWEPAWTVARLSAAGRAALGLE